MSDRFRVSHHTVSFLVLVATLVQWSIFALDQSHRRSADAKRNSVGLIKSLVGLERDRAVSYSRYPTSRPVDRYDWLQPPAQPGQQT
jgi:hypothetical protein